MQTACLQILLLRLKSVNVHENRICNPLFTDSFKKKRIKHDKDCLHDNYIVCEHHVVVGIVQMSVC